MIIKEWFRMQIMLSIVSLIAALVLFLPFSFDHFVGAFAGCMIGIWILGTVSDIRSGRLVLNR